MACARSRCSISPPSASRRSPSALSTWRFGGIGCCPNGLDTQSGLAAGVDDNNHGTRVGSIVASNGTSAPVGGARDASLALMVGGDASTVQRIMPVLQAMAKHIIHCGDSGAGMAAKLVNNALAHVNALAVCEAFSLGVRNGLDPKVLYDVVINSSGASWVLPKRFEQYIKSGAFNPGMKLDLLHKDSSLAMEMAHETDTPLFLLRIANSLFTSYKLQGLGDRNWAEMMTVWEKQLGIRIGAMVQDAAGSESE